MQIHQKCLILNIFKQREQITQDKQ